MLIAYDVSKIGTAEALCDQYCFNVYIMICEFN